MPGLVHASLWWPWCMQACTGPATCMVLQAAPRQRASCDVACRCLRGTPGQSLRARSRRTASPWSPWGARAIAACGCGTPRVASAVPPSPRGTPSMTRVRVRLPHLPGGLGTHAWMLVALMMGPCAARLILAGDLNVQPGLLLCRLITCLVSTSMALASPLPLTYTTFESSACNNCSLAGITCVAVHSDSAAVITGSQDGSVRLANLHTGRVVGALTGACGGMELQGCLASSPSLRLLENTLLGSAHRMPLGRPVLLTACTAFSSVGDGAQPLDLDLNTLRRP